MPPLEAEPGRPFQAPPRLLYCVVNDPSGPAGVQFEEVSFRNTWTTSPGKFPPLKELLWYTGFENDGVAFGVGNGGVALWNVPPWTPPRLAGERAVVNTTSQLDGSAAVEPMITWPNASGMAVAPGAG